MTDQEYRAEIDKLKIDAIDHANVACVGMLRASPLEIQRYRDEWDAAYHSALDRAAHKAGLRTMTYQAVHAVARVK